MNRKDAPTTAFVPESSGEILVLDRSDAELWATCPWAAKAKADGKLLCHSTAANSGNEVHHAISRVIQDHIGSGGGLRAGELRQAMESALRYSRPDVQPDALAGLMPSLWGVADLLSGIHPTNILAFDGGEGEKSGQLSYDVPFGDDTVRLTTEVDLLTATESIEVLDEIDWKTGWKEHTKGSIATSFQFQFHAVVVLTKFPNIRCVRVRVWNTRLRRLTYAVEFTRDDLPKYEARLKMAAYTFMQHRNAENPPTWPAVEKCVICDACAICPLLQGTETLDAAIDPGGYVERMAVLDAALGGMKKVAAALRKKLGHDIVGPTGAAFGWGKPKTDRAPSNKLYVAKPSDEDDEPTDE